MQTVHGRLLLLWSLLKVADTFDVASFVGWLVGWVVKKKSVIISTVNRAGLSQEWGANARVGGANEV